MRELGIAYANWSNDNDGELLTGYDDHQRFWMLRLAPYVGGLTTRVWTCPASTMGWPGYNWNGITSPANYSPNAIDPDSAYLGRWQRRVALLQDPSRTVNLAEGQIEFYSQDTWDSNVTPTVHGKGQNVLFFDGHVQYIENLTYEKVRDGMF